MVSAEVRLSRCTYLMRLELGKYSVTECGESPALAQRSRLSMARSAHTQHATTEHNACRATDDDDAGNSRRVDPSYSRPRPTVGVTRERTARECVRVESEFIYLFFHFRTYCRRKREGEGGGSRNYY